jgi:hypothetical protein
LVTENTVWRNIFGPKKEEGAYKWRQLMRNFHTLYSSHNIIWMIKSRKMGRAQYAWETSEIRTTFWAENPRGNN